MKEITLTVSIEEANLILNALGNLPYIKVHELIAKMQAQAAEQVKAAGENIPVPGTTQEE